MKVARGATSVRAEARAPALRALSAPLAGTGLELGAGHAPYPVSQEVVVRYVDRLLPDEAARLFPEVDGRFVNPQIVLDLDHEGLDKLPNDSQDFVIASHVIEHVADPIRLLRGLDRVVRPGGRIVLVVPNRECTFDRTREPTSIAHLEDEHARRVFRVDDGHILDFMAHTGQPPQELHWWRRRRLIRAHRARSVHAHCWNEPEFFQLLSHVGDRYATRWSHELWLPPDAYPGCFEFGYVLRIGSY